MSSAQLPVYIGAMTGTSIDGLDLAAISLTPTGEIQFVACTSAELPPSLANALHRLARSNEVDFELFGMADAQLGEYIGHCIDDWIEELTRTHQLRRAQIQAIGSHGQTIHHAPNANVPFTLQIGDPSRIALATNLSVVADFRRADVAAGGQGAPLVPPFHEHVFGDPNEHRVICNIGGISNITILPAHATSTPTPPVTGFDTGPGNTLLDSWYTAQGRPSGSASTFDRDGVWGRSGRVDSALLKRLLADPFFDQAAPKSTGPEHFNLAWLTPQLSGQSTADVQATLVELTALSLCSALPRTTEHLILCGGGRRNHFLVERIAQHFPMRLSHCDELGVDGDGLEAAAFAWFACRTLNGLTSNEPTVTGARHPQLLGNVTPAPTPQA